MNLHEVQARARKVARLVAAVPTPETRSQAERLAMTLAAFTADQRRRWAQSVGCLPPSDLTWELVVRTVSEGKTLSPAVTVRG